jgi:hypothetical protein
MPVNESARPGQRTADVSAHTITHNQGRKNMSIFEVDVTNMRKLMAARPKSFIINELIQNGWDATGTTRVDVKQGFQTFMLDFGRFNPNVKGKRAEFSIHRIDNVPLYSPATVKWATGKEQSAAGQRQPRKRAR